MPHSDEVVELVRRAQRGEPDAIDALVRLLLPYVARICGGIALHHADDATQETMIAMTTNISTLREPAALHGWVRRIAVREALRIVRRQSGAELCDPGDLELRASPDRSVGTDILDTLRALHPQDRAVLTLRHVDGLSGAEAAAVLGVPAGTVRSRLHRARRAFRDRWSDA